MEKVFMYNTFTGETVRFGHETAPFKKKLQFRAVQGNHVSFEAKLRKQDKVTQHRVNTIH